MESHFARGLLPPFGGELYATDHVNFTSIFSQLGMRGFGEWGGGKSGGALMRGCTSKGGRRAWFQVCVC